MGRLYLGWCYRDGDGVEQDLKKAAELFESSANKGNVYTMRELGHCYKDGGHGLDQDLELALHWFQKADESCTWT